jgi:hypothetical protein
VYELIRIAYELIRCFLSHRFTAVTVAEPGNWSIRERETAPHLDLNIRGFAPLLGDADGLACYPLVQADRHGSEVVTLPGGLPYTAGSTVPVYTVHT